MVGRRITDDDVAMLAELSRHRFMSAPQLARAMGRAEKVCYRRLDALRRYGLVAYERPLLSHGLYVATRAGLALAGVELPPSRVDIRTLYHDRAVVDLALELQRQGESTVTEREMRHHDGALRARLDDRWSAPGSIVPYGVELPKRLGEVEGLHYPDLVVEEHRGLLAYEVERVPKNRARLERILLGYARARHLTEVRYLVGDGRLANHVARRAAAVGADSVVSVTQWTPGSPLVVAGSQGG